MADSDRLQRLNTAALWVAALSLAVLAVASLISLAETAESSRVTRDHQIATEHYLAEANTWACVQLVTQEASQIGGFARRALGLDVLVPRGFMEGFLSPDLVRDVLRSARSICDHPDLGVLPDPD